MRLYAIILYGHTWRMWNLYCRVTDRLVDTIYYRNQNSILFAVWFIFSLRAHRLQRLIGDFSGKKNHRDTSGRQTNLNQAITFSRERLTAENSINYSLIHFDTICIVVLCRSDLFFDPLSCTTISSFVRYFSFTLNDKWEKRWLTTVRWNSIPLVSILWFMCVILIKITSDRLCIYSLSGLKSWTGTFRLN